MFSNTLTITIDAIAYTLIRQNQDNFGSVYRFRDGTRKLEMKIRHSTDVVSGVSFNRHNVVVEHTIFGTPTVNEQKFTATVTLRERDGADPSVLLKTWQGFNTLLLTLDDTLVVGEN